VQAQPLFGDPDYKLRVITRDLPARCFTTTASPPGPHTAAQFHPRHEKASSKTGPYRCEGQAGRTREPHR
jgi:hypothetical protein